MKTSEKIRQRLKEKGIRFHSNDNIADFLEGDDIEKLQKEVEESFSGVLDALVIDTENDHNTKETARRVAKMYMKEIFAGRFISPPKVTSFPNMGYWKSRLYLLLQGEMPVTDELPYSWHSTPNIHLCTIKDFKKKCTKSQLSISSTAVNRPLYLGSKCCIGILYFFTK